MSEINSSSTYEEIELRVLLMILLLLFTKCSFVRDNYCCVNKLFSNGVLYL